MKRETLRLLIDNFGQNYSDFLGVKLEGGDPEEILKELKGFCRKGKCDRCLAIASA